MEDSWKTIQKKQRTKSDKSNTQQTLEPEEDEWDKVTILTKKNQPKQTEKVLSNYTNQNVQSHADTKKLDENHDGGKHKTISLSIGQLLQDKLRELKMSHKDLFTKVGGKAGVNAYDIQQICKGEAIANEAKLVAIEKALNYRLRGKYVGQPYNMKA